MQLDSQRKLAANENRKNIWRFYCRAFYIAQDKEWRLEGIEKIIQVPIKEIFWNF